MPLSAACLQWLSGEWQIECTRAKGCLGDQVLFSGVVEGVSVQDGCLPAARVRSEEQWRHFSVADSAELSLPCPRGHVLCNRPCAVWTGNARKLGCSLTQQWGQIGMRVEC